MNKKMLVVISIIFALVLNMLFMPLKVNAETLDETPIEEVEEEEENQEPTEGEEQEEIDAEKEEGEKGEETEGLETPVDEKKVDETKEVPADEEKPVAEEEQQVNDLVEEESKESADEPKEAETNEPAKGLRAAPEEETETEEPTSDTPATNNSNAELQKAKVTFTKVDEDGNTLSGAILQILDKDGNLLGDWAEWETTDKAYEVELSAGEYILHEKKEPEGYEKAADIPFKVEIIINEDVVGTVTNFDDPTGHESQLYYVTINGETYEVYCVNQGLKTPNGNEYTGKILTPEDIRKFTVQETEVDTFDENGNRTYDLEYRKVPGYSGTAFFAQYETISDYDVSDQSLTNQQLYDKTLDIIYHRNLAQEKFSDMNYTEQEIRYITEWALKNYLNARITTIYETVRYFRSNGNFAHYTYYAGPDGQPLMDASGKPVTTNPDGSAATGSRYYRMDHKFYYREYRYAPGEEGAINDVIIDPGHGDSFGQIAKGMTQEERNRYAKLYYYLIGDDNNDNLPDHPTDMELYMYSPNTEFTDEEGNIIYYQNVLGIAGFFKDIKIIGTSVEITDRYSNEKVSVTVKKVWDDKDNHDGKRPESLKVTLSNGTTVTLNEANNWEATIKDLPKYDKGKLITYTWTEDKLPEGYKLTNTKTEGYVTTLTNSYTPEVRSIKVNKVWYDDNNQYQVRAKEVKVDILADGVVIKTIILNDENNWEDILTDLPVYADGKEIKYEVSEFEVEYYKVIIEEGKEGFTIYNYYDAKGGENPPPTGDNILLSIITLIISSGIFTTCVLIKKNSNI